MCKCAFTLLSEKILKIPLNLLKINITGSPEPFVQWNKDVNGLQRNSQILIDNSLEIFPTTLADTGHFSCLATNPFGSSYQATVLEIVGEYKF